MTSAWLFPGQGSQFVGMAHDLYERYDSARAVLDAANAVLGFELTRIMFEGPEAELTDTVNAQPALLAHSIAALAVWHEVTGGESAQPRYCAGHSLGEYSALVAAGALDLADAVKLVRARGEAMKRAGELAPGGMAAVLGLDDAAVAALCEQVGGVQVANYNAPGQVVISGDKTRLDEVIAAAKNAGAKRVIPLAVSIAAHSELMRPAQELYRPAVELTPLQEPRFPVISNVTVEPLADARAIREEMLAQLVSPVQWVKTISWMAENGVTEFVELGPKDVLSGLVKRIAGQGTARTIGTVENLEKEKVNAA